MNELKNEFKKILSALMLEHPFYALMLSKIRVESSKNIDVIAMTDGKKIVLNPSLFMKLEPRVRVGVLVHELHHIIELHPQRRRELMKKYPMDPIIYNIVEDGKINQHISIDFKLPYGAVLPRDVERLFGVSNVEKRSYEEIIAEIYKYKYIAQGGMPGNNDSQQGQDKGQGDVSIEPLPDGEVINEGSSDINNAKNDEELEANIKKAITESYVTAKNIGKIAGWLERYIKELTKSRIPWRRLLRIAIDANIGNEVFRTYTRPSKKMLSVETDVDLPSRRTYGFERIVALVDTSGSISENELRQFVSEIHAIFRETSKEIIVIPWDTRAYTPIKIRNSKDIKDLKLYGGGGTMIKDALSKALSMKPDVTIIFSDFAIGDLNNSDVQKMLWSLARNGKLILVSTVNDPPKIPKSISIKLELR